MFTLYSLVGKCSYFYGIRFQLVTDVNHVLDMLRVYYAVNMKRICRIAIHFRHADCMA
jgi:hypothetical protein